MVTASHDPNIYNPYLPVMAIFGLPRALFGPGIITDPRIWFALGFVAVFAAALAVAGARDVLRWTVLVTATPVIAFSLTVGGTDVPVLALLCLGLALLWRRPQPVLAGLVLGIAAATKATAWPALLVAATMLMVRDGRRAAVRFTLAAIAAAAVIIAPVAAVWPHALVENTILFPLGLAKVKSQAVSPLPGHVLADTGPLGHTIAVVLLCLAGLGVLVSLVVRPPRNVPSATWRLIIGLVLMFVLAPATRFGYFMYPLGLWAWLIVSQLGARHQRPTGPGADPERTPPRRAAQPARLSRPARPSQQPRRLSPRLLVRLSPGQRRVRASERRRVLADVRVRGDTAVALGQVAERLDGRLARRALARGQPGEAGAEDEVDGPRAERRVLLHDDRAELGLERVDLGKLGRGGVLDRCCWCSCSSTPGRCRSR